MNSSKCKSSRPIDSGEYEKIVLIGMMGSGKTEVGKKVGHLLGVQSVDLDCYIEEKLGQSVGEAIRSDENNFRNVEADAAIELVHGLQYEVISFGGGSLKTQRVRDCIVDCFVVWLDCPIDELVRRTSAQNIDRPLLFDNPRERLMDLFEARKMVYENCCDVRVNQDGESVEEVALKVVQHFIDFNQFVKRGDQYSENN